MSGEYKDWLEKNGLRATNGNFIKYLKEVKGLTDENARKYAGRRVSDKLNKAVDALSDLRGADKVGGGYVKDSGGSYVLYDSWGRKKGEFANFDEAAKAARKL